MSPTPEYAWFLGATDPYKVVHREGCRHARQPYIWAGKRSVTELADALECNPALALRWHKACAFCALDLAFALDERKRVWGYL